jgi:hypothetical protein
MRCEAEERVDAAVVQEAEAADLIAEEAVVARVDAASRRHPKHADLLVHVAEVRDLEVLGLGLEARAAIAAEEPGIAPIPRWRSAGTWQPSQSWKVSNQPEEITSPCCAG